MTRASSACAVETYQSSTTAEVDPGTETGSEGDDPGKGDAVGSTEGEDDAEGEGDTGGPADDVATGEPEDVGTLDTPPTEAGGVSSTEGEESHVIRRRRATRQTRHPQPRTRSR